MPKSGSEYLRIFGATAEVNHPTAGDAVWLAPLVEAFERATGWPLRFAGENASGHLEVDGAVAASHDLPLAGGRDAANDLAANISGLIERYCQAREALTHREAELATGVPLVEHPHEARHLADRLQALLKTAADTTRCDSAALYLLDEATTELRPRAVWNVTDTVFTDPSRLLCDCTADLEALCGHAIVLDDTQTYQHWNLPRRCGAAICVPVSSPTSPMGTLWLFDSKARPFSDEDVNVAEIVAGRLASDLEREILLNDRRTNRSQSQDLAAGEQWQQDQLPHVGPALDHWEVAGRARQAGAVGGAFYDWFVTEDGRLAAVAATCLDGGLPSALLASGLRSALRAHQPESTGVDDWLRRVHRTISQASPGDQFADVWCSLTDADGKRVEFAAVGDVAATLTKDGENHPLDVVPLPLGLGDELTVVARTLELGRGDTIAVMAGSGETNDPALRESERYNADLLAGVLDDRGVQEEPHDRAILVLKSRG